MESFDNDRNLIHFGGISLENGIVSKFHGPSGFERGVDMESQTFEIAYGKQVLYSHVRGNYFRVRKLNSCFEGYSFDANAPLTIVVEKIASAILLSIDGGLR